jgi:hypothetical protein
MSSEHVCSIRRAGVRADGSAQLDLKADDGAFDWNWFVSSTAIGREVLAIALTALATGSKVDCLFTEPIGAFTAVENAFLVT